MKLTYLNRKDYENKSFDYNYISPGQILAKIEYEPHFKCEFTEVKFEIPLEMRIASQFFPEYFSDTVVMVIKEESKFRALLQYAYEDWTNRV